jgi:hypothetical protein
MTSASDEMKRASKQKSKTQANQITNGEPSRTNQTHTYIAKARNNLKQLTLGMVGRAVVHVHEHDRLGVFVSLLL